MMRILTKIFFQQLKFVKKRIGPARIDDNRTLFYKKKDISILARNGFDFETSKKLWIWKKKIFKNY